jgi:hypothetical protein
MAVVRKMKESPWEQGIDEDVAYKLDTTPWGGTPTNEATVVKQNGRDVSDDVLTGTTSVSDDDITTPKVGSLSLGRQYRIEIKFDVSGNTFEAWGEFEATL